LAQKSGTSTVWKKVSTLWKNFSMAWITFSMLWKNPQKVFHGVEVPDFPAGLGGPDSPTPQGRGGLGMQPA
jgi:hypothetical protein